MGLRPQTPRAPLHAAKPRVRALGLALALPLLFISNVAFAFDDCPPGSYVKSEDGFSWCQPTVCIDDTQCNPGQVCREFSLCMQVGELAEAGAPAVDGSARLVVTQACAAEKRCPQLQTCSTMGRCFAPAIADRLGILAKADASTSTAEPPKKSSCGCSAIGTRGDYGFALVGFGVAIIALRARARRRARSRRE